MSACVAYGCTNRASKKIPGITFHRFPSNEMLKKAWILAIRRKNWQPTQYSRICSIHFSEDSLDRSLSKVYIKENAIPNIFPGYPMYEKSSEKPNYRIQEGKDDVSFGHNIISNHLDQSSNGSSTSSKESFIYPCNSISDEFNDQQLQSSDEESESEEHSSVLNENNESEEHTNILSEENVITFCDTSKQASSTCSPSPFVTKVVNILNSTPSPAAVVKPPSCAESLQIIQDIFSRSRIKEDQAKELIRRDIRRNSAFTDTYRKKVKLMQKMIAIQEKKVEALKRVTSSLKKERIIE